MALHLIVELGVKTMVIVHKDFLLNQWRERIAEFIPAARVGLIKAQKVDVIDKDIVLASVQSLSMKDYDDDMLFKGIGFIIVDECHRIACEVFSRALIKRTFRYSLGISATVQRKDGMTKALVHFLGDVLFKGKRREDDVLVVQKRFQDDTPSYRREERIGMSGNPNMSRMINNITEHAPRNKAIVDSIKYAIDKQPGRRVLVLSDRRAQLTALKEGLEALGITAGYYIGGMKPVALAESETKQVMCATFSFAAEGMDVPHLDTLVLASPKSDIEQSVGRILRLKAEHRERKPIVIDFVDTFSLFDRQGGKRRTFYRKFKYRIFDELEDAISVEHGTTVVNESDEDEDEIVDDSIGNQCLFVD
jgi:superfamily II DNA or RNA helicase